eukprot:TRINITY_DN3076_c0_g1_i1.p1 TRINITY_DN3076_c0_g1~~TRINITY_DN3076_c0_g1_i1.p1  ORF type:complete len:436 (-),score=58.08 TRINITY_DN3076_c0_g1_i1:2002-3309(-)
MFFVRNLGKRRVQPRKPHITKRTVVDLSADIFYSPSRSRSVMGILALFGGIAFLVLNERRKIKQELLTEKAREMCQKLDADKGDLQSLNEKLVISTANLYPDEPAIDYDFGVTHPRALSIRRKCEIYHYVEKKKLIKAKDETQQDQILYQYEKVWSTSPQVEFRGPSPPSNPAIPGNLLGTKKVSAKNIYFGDYQLGIPSQMLSQLDDYVELRLVEGKTCTNPGEFDIRGCYLYSKGGNPRKPQIGDMRISYEFLSSGKHTIVAKFLFDGLKFEPLRGRLIKYLSLEAPVVAPQQVTEVVGQTVVIPLWFTKAVEAYVLYMSPLEVAWLKKGVWRKHRAFRFIKRKDKERSEWMVGIGYTYVAVGLFLILSNFPMGLIPRLVVSSICGGAISYQTVEDAKSSQKNFSDAGQLKPSMDNVDKTKKEEGKERKNEIE